jgi:hypothetical protein
MKQTAVEWFVEEMFKQGYLNDKPLTINNIESFVKKAKEMEKQRMIDLVQQLKDYTRESNNVLGFDEREASEFVEILYYETFKSE